MHVAAFGLASEAIEPVDHWIGAEIVPHPFGSAHAAHILL